jgi:3(or 17)beta-hydroxysteroid dehydrogenase
MMGRLEGKVAMITGAAKGLGEADARIFAREGALVILTDVDRVNGERIAAEIGHGAEFHVQDVREEAGWEALIADVVARHGKLDILVNNAGVVEPGTIETQTEAEYRFIMAVSADGTFFGCKHAVLAMKKTGGGSIINMASIASIIYNIRCNSVHPAGILTPMVIGIGERFEELSGLRPANHAPAASRLGDPIDIANTVLFLASEESRFINGAAIRVDNAQSVIQGSVA